MLKSLLAWLGVLCLGDLRVSVRFSARREFAASERFH